jgi:hypothetical protein
MILMKKLITIQNQSKLQRVAKNVVRLRTLAPWEISFQTKANFE